MFKKREIHIHFVGIGGIGMSGIAEVLLNLGYRVSGTDLADSESTRRLSGLGATVFQGHDADYVGHADVVVISSAVRPENPEVQEAKRRHIPVIPRAEMLAELMRLKQGVVIAGSHGKTTTTSIVASILHEAREDPTVVIGGKVNGFGSNARLGEGDLMVAEADESDGSFLFLNPTFAAITNIDAEHLDHYGTLDALLNAFTGFANRIPFYGAAVLCLDDPNIRRILPSLTKRTVTYGFQDGADYRALEVVSEQGRSQFRVLVHGQDRGLFSIAMPGRHNVCNALAAIALCDEQNVHPALIKKALSEFEGVQRRFSIRGEINDILVVDDYGHHPTELRATLEGARSAYPGRRIVAAFQPHRYTRVRDHFEEFASSLDAADQVFLTDIHPAGESAIEGISSAALVQAIQGLNPKRSVKLEPKVSDLAEAMLPHLKPGDLAITLGAGSITQASYALVHALENAKA